MSLRFVESGQRGNWLSLAGVSHEAFRQAWKGRRCLRWLQRVAAGMSLDANFPTDSHSNLWCLILFHFPNFRRSLVKLWTEVILSFVKSQNETIYLGFGHPSPKPPRDKIFFSHSHRKYLSFSCSLSQECRNLSWSISSKLSGAIRSSRPVIDRLHLPILT